MASARDQEFLRVARERFQQAADATSTQRHRELEDLAFYAGGDHQWDPETLKARKAQQATAGLPPVPARPCLTINKVREPVHQVLNQERQSDMGIDVVPADDFGDLVGPIAPEEIELREGLIRRIQRESEAADARTWAFTRATIAGTGYYRVLTRYVPGKSWEKDVYVGRIYNQASVSIDPAHEQPDGSDAEWGFIGTDMPWPQYQREHAKAANGQTNALAHADDSTFRALGEDYPGWFTTEGETRSARVVEYFYTDWDTRTLVQLADGTAAWKDELPPDAPYEEERDVSQKTIKWAKIDATQILEETDWEGPDLPIIKVLGEELQPFDAERRVEGMVRPARDAQQGFNAMVSKWVESVGLAPIPPFQIADGQVEGYEAWYQAANTRTLPYLPYRTSDLQGHEVGAPTRTNVDTPIQAIAASVQMFDEAIKSTTMVPSVQLGQHTDAQLKSGKAIQALQQQAQLGTSNFLDNLKRSVRYEGQIINNLLFPIYGRPGRMARLLTGENEPKTVQVGPPPPATGVMPYAQPGSPPAPPLPGVPAAGGPSSLAPPMGAGPMGAPSRPAGPGAAPPKTYTLTKDAHFNVIVKVTRGFDSRREEEATTIGNLLQAQPALMGVFGDLFFKNQDGPGHDEMADRARVMLDPKIQAMLSAKDQGANGDPAAQAQIAAMKQQLDQAHQVMGQAQAELKDKAEQHQREMATKVQIVQMELASKEKLAALDRETKITVAELAAKVDRLTLFMEERGRVGAQLQDQAHEALTQQTQMGHEAMQNALDRQHAMDHTQQSHQNALEAGAQPPPVDPNAPPPDQPSPEGAL